MSDEQLAHRIGLLVVDNGRLAGIDKVVLRAHNKASSQMNVTTDDCTPNVFHGPTTLLVILAPDEQMDIVIHLGSNTAATHCRFCPITTIDYTANDEGWTLGLHGTGAITEDEIAKQIVGALLSAVRVSKDKIDRL